MKNTWSRLFVYRITIVAAVGGLLFGYDTAVIAGAIGFLQIKFGLSAMMVGWAASCALIGCIAGALFSGVLSDWLGRRKVLIFSAVLFALSSLGIAIPGDLNWFVFFRIIGGLGIGIASVLAPMYITEIAPSHERGKLVSINQLGIVTGILVIYFVNAAIADLYDETWNVEIGWRWMFASGIFPSLIFLILLFFVPESPRWLIKKGRNAEAFIVLEKINGEERAHLEAEEIIQSLHSESGSFAEIFRPGLMKALIIGVILAMFSQITGINAIMYYAPEIFKSTGDGSDSALLQTILVGVVNFLFTLVAIRYVDKVGRRGLLLIGSIGMTVCLATIGSAFHFGFSKGYLVLVSIMAYIAFFALSLGPLTFVVISEIFPNRTRGKAMSLSLFSLWIFVFIVSQSFPVMLNSLGSAYTFWCFMGMSILAGLFIYFFIPETKGKTLEEIETFWKRG
ncbi:MFS transporter, SP family, arabinose:H+ symporter [Pseudarcicella hirudinis]|uniref:MFS transporter, SP family, arabinose:H+ symporter n=1 Tax=Pseudarcicella hirudinis TaxID=1079859 RepID=A0A1I5TWN1_9BACT|nr:sugar porter family MFS transporter [Pseudarcicella hirudinis]SFP87301.1 MFS transporter, SP family, arabinose:H+ symporter [Pseudarcicella hirudinis]